MVDGAGIYNISMSDYIADRVLDVPTLSSSVAHTIISRSPHHAHWDHPRLNSRKRREASKPADLGSAAHALLLQADESEIVVINADSYRTKEARVRREAAYAAGLTPVLAAGFNAGRAMAKAARFFLAGSQLAGALDTGAPEQTVVAEVHGVWCRARPDWLNEDICLHYKTCQSAEPRAWIRRQLQSEGYDLAHQFYAAVLANVGRRVRSYFLVQETSEPYACSLIGLTPEWEDLAQRKLERALRIWRECLAEGHWPAYSYDIAYASPTSWQIAEVEEQMQIDAEQARHGLQP